jgi:uncharacterized Zn-binding protein involved in type VI secretion
LPNIPAARVGDDIAHSHAGLDMALGVGLGLLAGVVLVGATIATGGAALAVVAAVGGAAGMISAGGLGGEYIGEASMGSPCGKFTTGSPNVFINGRPATFTFGSYASCQKDSGPQALASGAATVILNAGLTGRQDEKVACSAKSVPQVSPDVFIGGPSANDPRVKVTPEVPRWAVTTLEILGVAGALLALPYSIVALGVAGTIGTGLAGAAGSFALSSAARPIGEALGLSETAIRSMEVGGGLIGGALAGGAAARFAAPRFGTPLATQEALGKMPLKVQAEYAAAKGAGWKKLDFGEAGARKIGTKTWYPPNNGAVGEPVVTRLPDGMQLDRFGGEHGSFMSAAGDSFEQRALPGTPAGTANKYTTAAGLDGDGLMAEQAPIAPWFEQPGGGTQYRIVDPATGGGDYSVQQAIADGYLTRGH